MLKTALTTILLMTGLTVFAHDGLADNPNDPNHTAPVCADVNPGVCTHLKLLSVINTSTEGEFIVHVTTPNDVLVSDLKVSLWMNMGGHSHGSAPVEIAAMDEANHFKISNAWFVMSGPWLVQVEFTLDGQPYKLAVPVTVAE